MTFITEMILISGGHYEETAFSRTRRSDAGMIAFRFVPPDAIHTAVAEGSVFVETVLA